MPSYLDFTNAKECFQKRLHPEEVMWAAPGGLVFMEEKNKTSVSKKSPDSMGSKKKGDAMPWVITAIILIVIIVGVTIWANSMNPGAVSPPITQNNTALIVPPVIANNTATNQPTAPAGIFQLSVNDFGFYSGTTSRPTLTVNSGQPVELDLMVMPSGVAGNGLEFIGCGVDSGLIVPSDTTQLLFTPTQDCTISAYTGTLQPYTQNGNLIMQSSLNIVVQ
jgi:hypothetical protein